MLFGRTKSVTSAAVTLIFSVALLLPCLCATAAAQPMEAAGEEASDCCPESAEDDESTEHEDSGCCCDGPTSCSSNDASDSPFVYQATTSSFDEDDFEAPTSWWTPQLVATLWLFDRLATYTDHSSPPPTTSTSISTDESETYLQHATLLL